MAAKHSRQTVETLLARTDEVGQCRVWRGYMSHGSPYVFHVGTMVSVRQVIAELQGVEHRAGGFWFATCGEPGCVEPRHIGWRSDAEHMRHLREKLQASSAAEMVRRTKISAAKRRLTDAQIDEIRSSDDAIDNLMARFGISRSLVYRCRRSPGNMHLSSNPWAALIATP